MESRDEGVGVGWKGVASWMVGGGEYREGVVARGV